MGSDDPEEDWSERLERCAHCGTALPMDEWRPVATVTDDDGTTQILSFCDESCKNAALNDEADGESID